MLVSGQKKCKKRIASTQLTTANDSIDRSSLCLRRKKETICIVKPHQSLKAKQTTVLTQSCSSNQFHPGPYHLGFLTLVHVFHASEEGSLRASMVVTAREISNCITAGSKAIDMSPPSAEEGDKRVNCSARNI